MSQSITKSLSYEETLEEQNKQEKAAVRLSSYVGNLLYDKGVELVLFRDHLTDRNTSSILNLHRYAREVVGQDIDVFTTCELALKLNELENLSPSKIDIGKLASEWIRQKHEYENQDAFLKDKLDGFFNGADPGITPRDVVLFGFGRIGRLVARELIKAAGKGQQLRLRAIVTRSLTEDTLKKRAALLRMDSVHGPFAGTVIEDFKNSRLIINGQVVHMITSKEPSQIDYTSYGIENALVIDNTGVYRDEQGLGLHLKAKGVSKVLLTAPAKGDIPNVVYGVNQEIVTDNHSILSAASCTTNAITPILKVINDNLKIEKGHIETVHAYTNDQNLLDNMHKKHRRGRSAAINMVITETGAGKAVTKAIPELKDKLTANAVRVPTPNGSLAIMKLSVEQETSKEKLNALLKDAALNGKLVNQIKYSFEEELVSNDIIGNSCCAVFDAPATIVHPKGKDIVLYTWYDNEFGYTKQVIRLAKYACKVRRLIYY